MRYGTTWGPLHGGDTWRQPPTEVVFDADEYVMGMEANDPFDVTALMFLTNKKSYGLYGTWDRPWAVITRRFCPQTKRLYYVDGRKGWYYDRLNFYFR